MVGEIKGHRLWRFPGKVPPSLFLRPDVLLSLFSEVLSTVTYQKQLFSRAASNYFKKPKNL